jgi:hypothetical protein
MNWLFWALLILGILLLVLPLLGVLEAALAIAFWLIGGLLLIGAVAWAVIVLARGAVLREPAEERP